MGVELGQAPDLVHHVGGVVHDDHARRAEHRALGDDALVVEQRLLGLLRGHDRNRGAARDDRLEGPARPRAAGHVVEDLPHRRAHGDLVVSRPLHVAADRDQLGSGALGIPEAEALVPGGAAHQDVRHGGQGLHVVDGGRHPEDAGHRRKRRLDAGVTPLPLQRVHHRGLFAADVGPRAAVDHHVDPLAAPEHVAPQGALRVGLLHRRTHHCERLGELAANVDVALLGADGV